MQLPLNLLEPPIPHLADGVAGRNSAALNALADLIGGGARGFASITLWGAPGCGKTFWLKAWSNDRPDQASYIDAGAGHAGQSPALHIENAVERLRQGEAASCLMIDNIDTADAQTAHQLFQLYNAGRESGGRIVSTASRAPLHLGIRDDLRTRLGQSLIFELHELSDAEKKAALLDRAQRLGLPLSEEIINYLFTRLPRDLGRLMQIIDGLNELTLSRQRAATIPLLKELLDSLHATTRSV